MTQLADDGPAEAPLAWQVKPPANRSDPRTRADVGRLLRIDQRRLDSLTGLTTPCALRPLLLNEVSALMEEESRDAQRHFAVATRRSRTRRVRRRKTARTRNVEAGPSGRMAPPLNAVRLNVL